MAVIYKCKRCGYVLYDSRYPERYAGIYFGLPTPSEVAAWYGGRCPRCGRILSTDPGLKDVSVGITVSEVLKANPSAKTFTGGMNEANSCCNSRFENGGSVPTGKGQLRETVPEGGGENLEGNKKRA